MVFLQATFSCFSKEVKYRRVNCGSLLRCIVIFLSVFSNGVGYAQTYLLRGATIISGENASSTAKRGSILVSDGRITTIYADDFVDFPNDMQIIDCTGKYVVPGLIDAHVHLATLDLTDRQKAMHTVDGILENMVRHGITTVRDMAGDGPFLADYKKQIAAGAKLGPDIFYAARFSGEQYFAMAWIKKSEPWECMIQDTTDLKKAVREAKACGATGLKLYAELSKKQFDEICEEAAKQGLLLWSHATVFPIKPAQVINKHVGSLSHAADLIFEQFDDEDVNPSLAWKRIYQEVMPDSTVLNRLFEDMVKADVMLDPTLLIAENNKLYHAATITNWAYKKGVKIVAGTDWPYGQGMEMVPLHDEALLLEQKAGLTNSDVFASLTIYGAEVLGLTDRGIIDVGKRADLLILDDNPLEDIKVLFRPRTIIKNGKLLGF